MKVLGPMLSVAYGVCCFSSSITMFCVLLIPVTFGFNMFRIIMLSAISKSSGTQGVGAVMGLCASFGSVARILAPMLSGYALTLHPFGPFAVCSGLTMLGSFLIYTLLGDQSSKAVTKKEN